MFDPETFFDTAEGPEVPEQDYETGEYDITYRAPFPGAPFRDNEFDRSDPDVPVPIIVCTPSVLNVAAKQSKQSWSVFVGLLLVAASMV